MCSSTAPNSKPPRHKLRQHQAQLPRRPHHKNKVQGRRWRFLRPPMPPTLKSMANLSAARLLRWGSPPGEHDLVVKKSGFKPWEKKIAVSSGHVKIDAQLEAESK